MPPKAGRGGGHDHGGRGRGAARGGYAGRGGRGGGRGAAVTPPAHAHVTSPPPPPVVPPGRAIPVSARDEEEKLSSALEEKAPIVLPTFTSRIPSRPGYGRAGTPMKILANHFKVVMKTQGDVYHYDASFAQEGGKKFGNGGVPPKELAEKLMRGLVAEIKAKNPRVAVVSDMRKNLYTPQRLPFCEELFSGLDIGERRGVEQTPVLFQALVKEAEPAAIRTHQLTEMCDGRLNYTPYDALMAYDIVLRYMASQRMTAVGRNLYSPQGAAYIGEGAECWNGYFQSLRPTQNRLVINLDLSATAFVRAMPVLQYVGEAIRSRDSSVPASLSASQISMASKAIRGVKVETTHRPGMKRAYRVNGLTPRSAAETMFADDTGRRLSVAQYFAENFRALRYPRLPCVHVGAQNKKIYFPIEVCNILAGQKCPRKPTDRQTAEMIKFARQNPNERKARIEQIVREANFSQDPTCQAFGLTVDTQMVTAQGRLLPPPTLEYGNGKRVRADPGMWRLPGVTPFLKTKKPLESFAVIVLDERARRDSIGRFFDKVVAKMRALGMSTVAQAPPVVWSRRGAQIKDLYAEAITTARSTYRKDAQLVWTVNPFQDSKTYAEIKRISDTEYGFPSQCMLSKHVDMAKDQYIDNILLKVHVKLEGRNWKLASQVPPKIASRTIIFGADVTHPSPGDMTRPSIAALVGSISDDFAAHASVVRAQDHRVEQIVNLKEMVMALLKAYYQSTRAKPQHIIFYRDGVSEGQFQMVLNHEVTAIREACSTIEPGYQPAITFVVVQKRHHTRFFVDNARDADRSGNVKAGTVVDNGVCHPTEYDFYLMSHAGLIGTSRPTHYHVLLDEIRMSPDELQTLTYHLCYTYARCLRSVSIVPSAYYSHLLAFRARCFLPDDFDSSSGVASDTSVSMETDMRMRNPHPKLQSVQYYI